MSESTHSIIGSDAKDPAGLLRSVFKRIMAGNPCYLASAGLLLYGINQLTMSDAKLTKEQAAPISDARPLKAALVSSHYFRIVVLMP